MRVQGRLERSHAGMRQCEPAHGQGGAAARALHRLARRQSGTTGHALHCGPLRQRAVHGGLVERVFGVERARQARHIEQARHRAAMRAGRVTGADRCAAVDAVDLAVARQHLGPIGARHRAHQALLGQVFGKGLPGTMRVAALELQRRPPACAVVDLLEPGAAMRAGDAWAKGLMRQALGLGHRPDHVEQCRARDACRLDCVEPDQMAGRTQVDLDRMAIVTCQLQGAHRRAAVAAGERRFSRWRWRRRRHGPAGPRDSCCAPSRRPRHG